MACCYFLACFGFWTELSGRQVLVLSGGYVLSRSMSGLSVASFPCARKTGTVATFSDAVQERTVMTCLYILLFLSAGFMCLLDAKLGTAAVVGAWCTFFWYYWRPGGLLRADLRAGHGHLRVGGGKILISAVWKKRSLRKQQENIGGNQT